MKMNKPLFESIGSGVVLFLRALYFLPTLPRQFRRFIEQCFQIGYKTLPLVAILSFCIGAVLALQIGYSFRDWGTQQFIGSIVGLSMVRELGPVMTAIMVTGRVGSAITAELASMRVYQEVDALHTMNIPPERILVMPRLAAIAVTMPVLTITSVLFGWFGGAVVAQNVAFISLDSAIYFRSLKDFVDTAAVMDGLIKAEVFGIAVVLICCNVGLRTTGGPREIGFSVTRAVVASIIFILLLDYFITRALL